MLVRRELEAERGRRQNAGTGRRRTTERAGGGGERGGRRQGGGGVEGGRGEGSARRRERREAPSANESAAPAEKTRGEGGPEGRRARRPSRGRERDPERAARPSGATPNAANAARARRRAESNVEPGHAQERPREGHQAPTPFSGASTTWASPSPNRGLRRNAAGAHGAQPFGGGSQALTMSVEAMAFLATPALVPASEDPLRPRIVRASAAEAGKRRRGVVPEGGHASRSASRGGSRAARGAREVALGEAGVARGAPAAELGHARRAAGPEAERRVCPARPRPGGAREFNSATPGRQARAVARGGFAAVKGPGEPETHAERPVPPGGSRRSRTTSRGCGSQRPARRGHAGPSRGIPRARGTRSRGYRGGNRPSPRGFLCDEGVEGIVEGVVEDVEGSIARSRVTFTSDAVPTSAGALASPPPAAASPRKVKKFKVPEGLQGRAQGGEG